MPKLICPVKLSNRLLEMMESKSISEIANLLAVSKPTVSNWIKGDSYPQLRHIGKIKKYVLDPKTF